MCCERSPIYPAFGQSAYIKNKDCPDYHPQPIHYYSTSRMKLAGVCIVLLALATASYAAPSYEDREERANQQDILNALLKKMIQKKQAEAQMARYEEARSQLNVVLQNLQDNEALTQDQVTDILGTVLDTAVKTLPSLIPLIAGAFG